MGGTPRVVAVGGGHGLSRALAAVRRLGTAPTAIVTVADDGGSSGRLRRDLGIIAPGDLRMAMLTLARNRPLADVLAHRFTRGQLEGHALGNLLLVALAEQTDGDFVAALDRAAALLACDGRVLPATTTPVVLHAEVAGERVDGQARVAKAAGRIERVWLEPGDPSACPDAVAACGSADLVVLGPGSLFTSVIANLLVPGLVAALDRPTVVYVANTHAQVGETSGLDTAAHVDALLAHAPGLRLDAVVLHEGPSAEGNGPPLAPELDDARVGTVVRADVAPRRPDGTVGWGHDPGRLAEALASLLAPAASG